MKHNGMEGDLFTGEPLKVVGNPDRDIRAQQIANSLASLNSNCAIPDEVWQAVYTKCGYRGEVTQAFIGRAKNEVDFAVKVTEQIRVKEKHTKSADTDKVYKSQLNQIARRLMLP